MTAPGSDRRRVLVTGAASGIGRATALALRARGDHLTGVDRADPGDAAHDWIAADLSDLASIPGLPLRGPYDALVNSAGLPPRPGTEAAILTVNFLALRALSARVVPMMRPGGAIVSLGSKAGQHWRANIEQVRRLTALRGAGRMADFVLAEGIDAVRAYDLSKEAVIAWTKAATRELLARDLRANTVSPAAVETPILGDFVTAFGDRAKRGIAMTGRSGTPDEIAAVIAFLCSPESGWIRGCNIECDGGLTALLDAEALDLTAAHGFPEDAGKR